MRSLCFHTYNNHFALLLIVLHCSALRSPFAIRIARARIAKSIFLPRRIASSLGCIRRDAMKSSRRDLDRTGKLLSRIIEAE